eukprot:CAMPEP_0172682810 /NCGR_PEP_ID=MMETSP1074-20121228/18417_1 /TAXON_ID=2916 /ORGANISM="Ceratium fusus, Strain PA161109" /LENGTH=912 /DNA_ID=CAMNT_0013501551 /DNA_START=26 /DNA_END=2764 /DNA_ORIENTATION=+
MANRTPLLRSTTTQAYEIDQKGFLFDKVFREEQEAIQKMMEARVDDGKPSDTTFALAFSGGGMRAAAFQCGVLWRLAEANLLKDVTYMTAVSGGGYITMAYATHCIAEGNPEPGKAHEWYRRVVAKTIVRMQQNAGDFVRDFGRSGSGRPDDNSGCTDFPRALDTPVLILTLLCTMLVHPLYFFMCFMVPITMMAEAWFGDSLRSAFCSNAASSHHEPLWMHEFLWDPNFRILLNTSVVFFMATLALFLLRKIIPAFKDPNVTAKKSQRVEVPASFLLGYGLYAFLVRATLILFVNVGFILSVLALQVVAFSYEHGSPELQAMFCPTANGTVAEGTCLDSSAGCLPEVFNHVLKVLFGIFAAAILMMPYVGSGQALNIACVSGPLLIGLFQIRLTQFRVFGPLTGQDFFPRGVPFCKEGWDTFVGCVMILTLIMVPIYPEVRALLHTYYMRCLSGNFFANGEDVAMSEMEKCPYCPFIVVTGTSSDYKPPIGEDDDEISELSFSKLHCGSNETGYVRMPNDRTIGKCTALTAAGCIDACALTLSSLLTLRFWLEALNLSWGDYIVFKDNNPEDHEEVPWFLNIPGEADRRLVLRFPADTAIWTVYVLNLIGFFWDIPALYFVGLMLFTALYGLSFFCFGPIEEWVAFSPFLRQLQQATAFCYRGKHPPPMLYVTDGGCRDCCTLVQLMMRRQERILLVLAPADPHDDLAVFKVAMGMVKNLEYASFYNPEDPRLDVDAMLAHFKFDKTIPYLQLGINYPKTATEERKFGTLFIVKNRLPPAFVGQMVEPHLTEEEVMGEAERGMGPPPEGVKPFNRDEWGKMTTDNLGPFCCCDFSHTKGFANCGPKFPHGNFVNFMYMTPMWCSSLARLAYDMSKEVVTQVSTRDDLQKSWEKEIENTRGNPLGSFDRDAL